LEVGSPKQPDYETIRNRVLKNWRVAKRAESRERLQQLLDAFIAELVGTTGEPTPLSTDLSAPNGTAAPLVDEAVRKLKQRSITQDDYYAELKQITARCGYRLSITPLGTGRNVFHIHPTGSPNAEVSTQDINEVVDWLRGQDLLGE
jgi:hypothetical protein